ncbi:MAG: S-layer homology domain-containing protein [Bacillota bacterium]|nr:S-layer homology domain-containing protein [Bacillota bacterium]
MKKKLTSLEGLLIILTLILSLCLSPSHIFAQELEGNRLGIQDEPSLEAESLTAGGLELGENLVGPALRGNKKEIHIRTNEELIALLNSEYKSYEFQNDEWRYMVRNTNIYLEDDFVISSDDINDQFLENTAHEKYEHAFCLANSNFYGQGHTITINQGHRDMYSLFGKLEIGGDDTVNEIKDLKLVYKGDVRGTGFAQTTSSNGTGIFKFSNIDITVDGNILPLLRKGKNIQVNETRAEAAGFMLGLSFAEVDGVKIHVTGNIGSEQAEQSLESDTDIIYGRSAGFILDPSQVSDIDVRNQYKGMENLDIAVDGSIVATSKRRQAEATGLGYNLQYKLFKGVKVAVGGDIKAITSEKLDSRTYAGNRYLPNIAAGAGKDLRHLSNVTINIGGSIMAENDGDGKYSTAALGIGFWDYWNGLGNDEDRKALPLTIKGVNLNVGGNISAKSNHNYYKFSELSSFVPETIAVLGFDNDRTDAFIYQEFFEDNKLIAQGDLIAEGKDGTSHAYLWGNFRGKNNQLSANSLQATNETGEVFVAPYMHFLSGTGNSVTLEANMVAKGKGGNLAGFANTVTLFDGKKDGNKIKIKGFQAEGIKRFGGFANYAKKHENQPNMEIEVKNVDLYLEDIVIKNPAKGALIGGFISSNGNKISGARVYGKDFTVDNSQASYIGGFLANNRKNMQIEDTSVSFENLKVNGYGDVGGYVGYNSGDITASDVQFNSMSIVGDPASQDTNHFNLGGFEGYGYGGTIKNSSALIVDGLTTTNGNYVNLGSFTGISYDPTYVNDAAQVGENLTSTNNLGVNNIGGFAGKLLAYGDTATVDKSTALVFGDMSGETTVSGYSNYVGGFIGDFRGKTDEENQTYIKDSASYVGGDLSMTAQKPIYSYGLGLIQNATLQGFAILDSLGDDPAKDKEVIDKYLGAAGGKFNFTNNYLVEVVEGKRTAFPISLSDDGQFQKGAELGSITIAGRKLQNKYWGAEADSSLGEYKDFKYVKENESNIAFTPIATGSRDISISPFEKASLANFGLRHLSLSGENGPIFDILGIPAGEADDEFEGGMGGGIDEEAGGIGGPFDFNPLFFLTGPVLNTDDHYQYMTGYEDQTFRPNRNISREEVTAMFSRLLNERPEKNKVYDYDFSDVEVSRWSITPISYMSSIAMIKGYPDGSFQPGKSISRAEFAAMATRFADLDEGEATFTDVDSDHWAYSAIAKAASAGWVSGYPDGTFKPNQAITRAEVVSVTNRMLSRYADQAYIRKYDQEIMYFSDMTPDHWAYYPIVEATNGHDYSREHGRLREYWKNLNNKSFVYDR